MKYYHINAGQYAMGMPSSYFFMKDNGTRLTFQT